MAKLKSIKIGRGQSPSPTIVEINIAKIHKKTGG
jgi:hypothetical protein